MIGGVDMAKLSLFRNFSSFKNINGTHLGSYLAGLFEGNGHIWFYNNEGKKHNPRFHITFNIKDLPLVEKLLSIVGSGFICITILNLIVMLSF